MEQIECSETSAYINQTPGNHPKENKQHSEHGESLKLRINRTCLQRLRKTTHRLLGQPVPELRFAPSTRRIQEFNYELINKIYELCLEPICALPSITIINRKGKHNSMFSLRQLTVVQFYRHHNTNTGMIFEFPALSASLLETWLYAPLWT